ncbi:hypothetical protein [uncultured Umboniibacter sp.]|uniref:hypothetical protein n=1 Tax=uncultured Umboniibacter sp. TaxID=1798917 RepID=UPI00262366B7|nr:hypothetical protein [uncultured Umboniibacter sp.]
MKNILVDVCRPGDFFDQMAIFCALEDELKAWPGKLFIFKHSLYLHPKRFLPAVFSDDRTQIIKERSELNGVEYIGKTEKYAFNGKPAKIKYNYAKLFAAFSTRSGDRKSHVNSDTIKCVITIECEKRRFLSQLPLLSRFSKKIQENFGKRVHFINSGMTSTFRGELVGVQSEQYDFEDSFLRNLSKLSGASYENLWGESMGSKLKSISAAHCAISCAGTAAVLPNLYALPCLTFGNQYITNNVTRRGIRGANEILIPEEMTVTLKPEANFSNNSFGKTDQLNSYDVSDGVYEDFLERLIAAIR